MSVTRASDLAKRRFKGLKLSKPFSDLLGDIEPRAYLLIWGPAGSGKSTFALALADELATNGPALYVSAEEGVSKTVRDRINRLEAKHPDLYVAEYLSLEKIKLQVRQTGARFVMLDSISQIDPSSARFAALAKEFQHDGIGLAVIAHATKDGKNYKGPTSVGHNPDVIIRVAGGEATTTKNRYAPTPVSIDVPFTAAALPRNRHRHNPHRIAEGDVVTFIWDNDNSQRTGTVAQTPTSGDDIFFVWINDSGFKMPVAAYLDSIVRVDVGQSRRNPVAVPFTTTLREIVAIVKPKGVAALNAAVGFEYPAFLDWMDLHEDVREDLAERLRSNNTSFRWRTKSRATPDGREKIGVLEMIRYKRQVEMLPDADSESDTDLERYAEGDTYIEQFEGRDFADALGAMLRAYGKMRVVVTDQAHAKKVLGAKEYGRQSKALEGAKPKAAASKPKAAPRKRSAPKATPSGDAPPRRKPAKAAQKPKRMATPKADNEPTAPKRTTTGGGASSGRKPRSKSSEAQGGGDAQRFDQGIASLTAALQNLDT